MKTTTTTKGLDYYTYETAKVKITWNGKVQPYGYFKSARQANTFLNENCFFNQIFEHKIVTPDATLTPEYDPKPRYNPYAKDIYSNQ